MRIYYHPDSELHAPQWYIADAAQRPCPECPPRIQSILEALLADDAFLLTESLSDPLPFIEHTHDPHFLHYLQNIHARWVAEFGPRDVLPDTFIPPTRQGKLTLPSNLTSQPGYFCFDLAAPITQDTWPSALASAATAVSAAQALHSGQRAAYALCRPPGHHAGRDYHGGFCYLNNIAIAAEFLLQNGASRIAILDVDYHHGNGTQDIFYHRKDVLFVSLHADPNTQYPYFWGHAAETGLGKGEGFNVNFPLPRGTGEIEWFTTLAQALLHIQLYKPDALLVSLGVDTAIHDGVGDFGLSPDSFSQLGQMLAALKLPTLFVQEGGYNLDQIGLCVRNTLSGFRSQ